MADILAHVLEQLKEIRTYLVKIGAKRRQKDIGGKKLLEANAIYNEYLHTYEYINSEIESSKIKESDILLYRQIFCDIESLFQQINQLCTVESDTSISVTMSNFDLRVALSLIPNMTTNDEITIKQVIDSIDYYDSLLDKKECKEKLINFVLKSRLSQSAKLRLNISYSSITDLLQDMRKHLLPQKGSTALQIKLQNVKQNNMSIKEFGDEISELMTDLTISQADNDSNSFKVLKPLNEKLAIKRFSDGLRNRRLSTIIAARNFEYLKDAVQAAIDEEVSSSSTLTGEVMHMNRTHYYHNGNSRRQRGTYFRQRGNGVGAFTRRGQSGSGYVRGAAYPQRPTRGRSWARAGYQGASSSRYNNYRYRGNQRMGSNQIHMVTEPEKAPSNNDLKFFRD